MQFQRQSAASVPPFFFHDGEVSAILVEQTRTTVVEVLTKICGAVEVLESDATDFTHGFKIDGTISFVGDLSFSLVFRLPIMSAERIAHEFAGVKIPGESEEMVDVVGELTNILAGALCGRLEDQGVKSQMSLPTVTRGSDFQRMPSESLVAAELFFVASEAHFMVRLVVARDK